MSTSASWQAPRGTSSRIEAIRTRGFDHPHLPQLLVDVITEDGLIGTGEAWWGIASAGRSATVGTAPHGTPARAIAGERPSGARLPHAPYATIQAAIEGVLAPRCIGRLAGDIEALWFDMSDFASRYGDGGVITMGLSGIDLALWDRLGKQFGVPVNQLIGGRAHERRPAYASLPALRIDEAIERECRRAVDAGFLAIKLHEVTAHAVACARAAVGPHIALMVDCNGHFDVRDSIQFAHAIARHDVLWLEEPVRPMRDIASLARVAAASPLPLAAGENEYSPADFQRLLASGALAWLQPEIAKIGGLTAARRISALAELHNVVLAPHNFRIGPSLYASIHWGLSSPATGWIELPWLAHGVTFPSGATLPPLIDGQVGLPEGPGFGLAV